LTIEEATISAKSVVSHLAYFIVSIRKHNNMIITFRGLPIILFLQIYSFYFKKQTKKIKLEKSSFFF